MGNFYVELFGPFIFFAIILASFIFIVKDNKWENSGAIFYRPYQDRMGDTTMCITIILLLFIVLVIRGITP